MDHGTNGQTKYWSTSRIDHNRTSLGSTIDVELKLATELPKVNMILGYTENFQQMLKVQVRAGENDNFL